MVPVRAECVVLQDRWYRGDRVNATMSMARAHLKLGDTHCRGQRYIAHLAMAVIHQRVSGKAQLRFLAQTFA